MYTCMHDARRFGADNSLCIPTVYVHTVHTVVSKERRGEGSPISQLSCCCRYRDLGTWSSLVVNRWTFLGKSWSGLDTFLWNVWLSFPTVNLELGLVMF